MNSMAPLSYLSFGKGTRGCAHAYARTPHRGGLPSCQRPRRPPRARSPESERLGVRVGRVIFLMMMRLLSVSATSMAARSLAVVWVIRMYRWSGEPATVLLSGGVTRCLKPPASTCRERTTECYLTTEKVDKEENDRLQDTHRTSPSSGSPTGRLWADQGPQETPLHHRRSGDKAFNQISSKSNPISSPVGKSGAREPPLLHMSQTHVAELRNQTHLKTLKHKGSAVDCVYPALRRTDSTDTYPTESSPPHKRYPTPQPSRSPTNTNQNTHSPHHARRGTTKTPTPSCTRGLVTRQLRSLWRELSPLLRLG